MPIATATESSFVSWKRNREVKISPFFFAARRDDAMNESFQWASGTPLVVWCRSSRGHSPRHSSSAPSPGPFKSRRLTQTQSRRSPSWCASHHQRQQCVLSPASGKWHNRPSADSAVWTRLRDAAVLSESTFPCGYCLLVYFHERLSERHSFAGPWASRITFSSANRLVFA